MLLASVTGAPHWLLTSQLSHLKRTCAWWGCACSCLLSTHFLKYLPSRAKLVIIWAALEIPEAVELTDPQHVGRRCFTQQIPSPWGMAWCLHGWACSQAAEMWGTSCPLLEDSCTYIVRLQGALQRMWLSPEGGTAGRQYCSKAFSYKLVWTVIYGQGISLCPNPLPAWVVWHLLWSSKQVIDEPDIYFSSVPGNNLSRMVQCSVVFNVKKGHVHSTWNLKGWLN